MKEVSLFWALKNNKTVHISEVTNGLKCECVCPVCHSKLVAHKGQSYRHHFKHYEIANCKGAIETSIHLAAKRLFLAKKEVLLPDLFAYVPEFGEQKVLSGKHYKSKTAFEEYRIDDFQPDIFMEIEYKKRGVVYLLQLIVEIAVTHFVDSEKLNKIKKTNISAIEIHLDKIDRIKNDEELWSELTKQENIKWLFNSRLAKHIEKKRNNIIEHQKNIEKKIEKLEELKENERKEFRQQNLSLFKIYKFRKDYSRWDVSADFIPFQGTVYCPKNKIENKNKEITLEECEYCDYHLHKHFESTNIDSDVYVVCGLKANKLRD